MKIENVQNRKCAKEAILLIVLNKKIILTDTDYNETNGRGRPDNEDYKTYQSFYGYGRDYVWGGKLCDIEGGAVFLPE